MRQGQSHQQEKTAARLTSWGYNKYKYEIEQNELEEMCYLLNVHGIAPGRKGEGVKRLIHENLKGRNLFLPFIKGISFFPENIL